MDKFDFDQFLARVLQHPAFEQRGVELHYKKGEYLFRQGEVCTEVFFMSRGLVKFYFNTLEGKEWIKSFVADKGVLGSRSSQLLKMPSPFSALCLEDTQVVRFPYEIFEAVCFDNLELAQAVFHFTQWLGVKKELREYQLLCLSAEEAYQAFVSSNPTLVTRLTQIDIARYLGITPIALSRIKKRLA